MTLRVVFDSNVVLSALRFQEGELTWLRGHWAGGQVVALASRETVDELIRVLAYPKFRLVPADIQELLGDYLPYVEIVRASAARAVRCRDPGDQKFIDLAVAAKADVLVTGDRDLLALRDAAPCSIETPAEYRRRFA